MSAVYRRCYNIFECDRILTHLLTDIDCGDPIIPPNGERTGTATTVGNQLNYECKPGFKLIGTSKLVCQKDGTWSAAVPSCVGKIINNQCLQFFLERYLIAGKFSNYVSLIKQGPKQSRTKVGLKFVV